MRTIETGSRLRIPKVDFVNREVVFFGVGPRSSTGYSLKVVRVSENERRFEVLVDEVTPTLADRTVPRVTFPFVLLELPRSSKPVHLNWVNRP